MNTSDFFLSDGSINMEAAKRAASAARADTTKAGVRGALRLFRRPTPMGSSDLR